MAPWILIAVGALIVILGIVAIITLKANKGRKHEPDYYTFFVIGIVWIIFGAIPGNSVFLVMGIAFAVIGLAHKDEWKKNHKNWKQLKGRQRKIMILMVILGLLALFAGIIFYLFVKNGTLF